MTRLFVNTFGPLWGKVCGVRYQKGDTFVYKFVKKLMLFESQKRKQSWDKYVNIKGG